MAKKMCMVVKLLLVMLLSLVELQQHLALAKCHFENGNFSHSCKDMKLVMEGGRLQLQATCSSPTAPFSVTSTLILNEEVMNDNGALRCQVCDVIFNFDKQCAFSHTCENIQLSGTVLSATCRNHTQQPIASSVDLNDCVVNHLGNLDWVCV